MKLLITCVQTIWNRNLFQHLLLRGVKNEFYNVFPSYNYHIIITSIIAKNLDVFGLIFTLFRMLFFNAMGWFACNIPDTVIVGMSGQTHIISIMKWTAIGSAVGSVIQCLLDVNKYINIASDKHLEKQARIICICTFGVATLYFWLYVSNLEMLFWHYGFYAVSFLVIFILLRHILNEGQEMADMQSKKNNKSECIWIRH